MNPLLALTLALALADVPPSPVKAPDETQVREAVTRALPLLEKGSAGHRAQRTCFACHHQAVPLLALTTARARGLPVNEEEVQKHLVFIRDFLERNRENYLKGKGQGGQADTAGYALWALEVGGYKADPTTAAVAEYLLLYQQDRDHWRTNSNRPPSEASAFTTSYLGVRGLQTFATAEQQERVERKLRAARAWLDKAPVRDTEDRVFRLWLLKRLGAETAALETAAQALLETQRPDGGWAQLDDADADAYATGSALVALREAAGLAATDAVYQRGLAYLLAQQKPDGSWHVRSRAKPFQLYFESGFPYGKDQFISLAASSWATTALALALPVQQALPEPTKLTVEFAGGVVTVKGTKLTLPIERQDLLRVLGKPDREVRAANTLLFWDELGILAYQVPSTEKVRSLQIILDREAIQDRPKQLFTGTLKVEGASITAESKVEAINRAIQPRVFVKDVNLSNVLRVGYWKVAYQDCHLFLREADPLSKSEKANLSSLALDLNEKE